MKKFTCLAAVSAAMVATPVMAQENDDMGGPWVAFIAGIDSVEISALGESDSEEDIAYGISAGYNADLGSTVIGVEAEYADSRVGVSGEDVFDDGDRLALDATRDLYIGARVGFKATPSAMVYLKGGYTNAGLRLTYDDGFDEYSVSDELDGYRLGAGAEFKISDMISARIEYRYSDYGSYDYEDIDVAVSASRHQGVAGLVVQF